MSNAAASGQPRRKLRAPVSWIAVGVYLLLMSWLSACASVAPVLKIGLVGPFEGKHRAIGYDMIYSARLAVRQVNEGGGIGGYRITLVTLDDGGDPELAAAAAASLAIDPAVLLVFGHWLLETNAAAAPIYVRAGLPFLRAGAAPFETSDPDLLPADFLAAYEAVTPFDEVAGPYAAATYDAFQLAWLALAQAAQHEARIEREAVGQALSDLQYEGLTGIVYQP